jgi:hypothetical protein
VSLRPVFYPRALPVKRTDLARESACWSHVRGKIVQVQSTSHIVSWFLRASGGQLPFIGRANNILTGFVWSLGKAFIVAGLQDLHEDRQMV